MTIFTRLQKNKGTVSSALGKKLAQEVLDGNIEILNEAINLCVYDTDNIKSKIIRSGAAKIVEIVAEKKPELVAPHLDKLMNALNVKEPQTRWMIIRVMGFCAHLNKKAAVKAIEYAEKYITKKEGLCIASSADLFLGDIGALSKKDAGKVYPLLEQSVANYVYNEQDWLLEAFIKISKNIGNDEKKKIRSFAKRWESTSRKSTQARAKKLLELLGQ
jgi:hypothetical protein